MHLARVITGVEGIQTDGLMQTLNGGMPVSGAGDFSVMIIDSDSETLTRRTLDLQFGSKVVQNVHTISDTELVAGFTPNVVVENVPNTDESVGHGTHCAGIIGGDGVRSGGA